MSSHMLKQRRTQSRTQSSAMIPGAATEFEALDADQFLQPDSEMAPYRRNANFSGSFAGKDAGVTHEPVSTVGQLEDLLQQLEEGDGNQPEAQIFGANLAASHGTHEPSSFASNSKDKRTAEAAQRKLDKYKDLILEAKSKLKEAKKENEKLQDENARLRAAEAALEDEINGAGNKDDLNAMLNKAHLSNEELEQRRVAQAQKREAREAARKKRLEESTDDALDRGVDRHRGRGRLEGSLSLMCDTMDRSMDRVFQPLKKHVDYMTARFGGGVGIYFSLLSNMYVSSLLVMFCWIAFWVIHIVNGSESASPMADQLMPAWSLNSSVSSSEASHFIMAFLFSIVFMWARAINLFLRDDRESYTIDYFEEKEAQGEDPKKMVQYRMVLDALNPWSFAVDDSGDNDDQKAMLANRFKSLLNEIERIEIMDSRTDDEWKWLYLRRAAGFSINFILICGQWLAIIILTVMSTNIQAASGGGTVGALVVPLCISAINAALPMATSLITTFEQWDAQSTHLRIESARLFVSRMLNAFLLAVSYSQLLTGTIIYDNTQAEADVIKWGNCFEDQIGSTIMELVLADFLIPKLVTIGVCVGKNWFDRWKNDLPICSGKFQRQPFDLASELIQLMYTQTLLWMLMPYYSFFVLFGAFQHWISFHYYKIVLVSYFEKPVGIDVGQMASQVSIMYLMTLFFCTFLYVGWLSGPIKRYGGCSPFAGADTAVYTTNEAALEFWNLLGKESDSTAYSVLNSIYFYSFIIAIALTLYGHKNNYIWGYEKFYDHRITGYERQMDEHQKDIGLLKKKLKDSRFLIEELERNAKYK